MHQDNSLQFFSLCFLCSFSRVESHWLCWTKMKSKKVKLQLEFDDQQSILFECICSGTILNNVINLCSVTDVMPIPRISFDFNHSEAVFRFYLLLLVFHSKISFQNLPNDNIKHFVWPNVILLWFIFLANKTKYWQNSH